MSGRARLANGPSSRTVHTAVIISSTDAVYCRRNVHSRRVIIAATIVFDFDGTVAIGSGPVLAYARRIAEAAGRDALPGAVAAELDDADRARRFPRGVLDGYDLVRRRAEAAGVEARVIEAAYLASRASLGTDEAPVGVPEGLPSLLDALAEHARLVLVTNAPDTSLDRALDALGLRGRFHETHPSAGKPDGLRPLARRWLAAGRLLSIGDIWVNDLEPVHELGGDTALIGAVPPGAAPTFRGDTLPDLYPDLLRWATGADPAASAEPILTPSRTITPDTETEPHTP